ncbi:MAG: mannosyl-3-phosphoglycerate phosphatase [Deltaproteobacteria bacterium HGW-Deltaproteobacteria-19]|jgi:mannosyl-3-phosphoglycerate phosphatase|nr:MAG: mannosyl-3-phosphoglycerate phosphatase [Deltaproteobacteria bacterium HGW-Deltaproteobacteria-19]
MKWLLFSDLDGTLLNHDDYSYEDARPVLERIRREGIPLVIASSKTRVEVEEIQEEIGLRMPFIVENGGGIYFPRGCRGTPYLPGSEREPYFAVRLGMPYEEIREFVARAQQRIPLRGFGDMTVEEVARLTDLPLERARLAKTREFSEPFLLEDGEWLPELTARADEIGLSITRGGRFFHLVRHGQDKGRAVRFVKTVFRRQWNEPILTVGLGDSLNDIPLLMAVDYPVLIPSPGGKELQIEVPRLILATVPGSLGWRKSVEGILGWTGEREGEIPGGGRDAENRDKMGDDKDKGENS